MGAFRICSACFVDLISGIVLIMDKVFSIKVQEIRSPAGAPGDYVSLPYIFDPEDKLMEEQRGKLFAVLDISGGNISNEDLNAGARLILNVLKETYFGELEGTPLQALEKAFHVAKEKISNMPIGDKNASPHLLDLNLIVAVLWGKVLYVAQFGSCSAYIIKEAAVVNIGKEEKGDMVVSSGIVEKGDVLVLGSSTFKEIFNLENLSQDLSKLSNEGFLRENKKLSVIIVKFDVLNFWGSDDAIKFVVPGKPSVFSKPSKIISSLLKVFSREPRIKVPSSSFEDRSKKKFAIFGVVAILLTAGLSFSIIVSLKKGQKNQPEKNVTSVVKGLYEKLDSAKELVGKDDAKAKELLSAISSVELGEVKPEEKEELEKVLGEATSILDKIDGVVPIEKVTTLYDVSVDGVTAPSSMAHSEKILYVWSKGADVGVKLDLSGDKVLSSKIEFGNTPDFVDLYDGDIYTLGGSGMYLSSDGAVSFTKQDISGDFSSSSARAFKIYYGNGYVLAKDAIFKISVLENGYSANSWLKIPLSLEKAVDFAIDGNLYVLFSDGGVKKLYMGEEDTAFMLKNLPQNLKGPEFIYTNVDLNDIYILDAADKSIVVVDKVGEYQKKYRIKDDSVNFEEIKGFVLDASSNKVFILFGTKIAEFGL